MSTDELDLAYKIRHALNDNLDGLPPATLARLRATRETAVANKKQEAPEYLYAAAGALGDQFADIVSRPFSWIARMGLALPVIVLIAGLGLIYQIEHQERISETAELDAMVLADELPPTAYADHGFNAYLSKRGRE